MMDEEGHHNNHVTNCEIEDSDCDVVFENSPLHQHLTDCGIEHPVYRTKHTSRNEEFNDISGIDNSFVWVKSFVGTLFSSMCSFSWAKDLIKNPQNNYIKESLFKNIVDSKLMVEDDVIFLDNIASLHPMRTDQDKKLNTKFWIFRAMIFISLISYIFQRVVDKEPTFKFLLLTDVFAFLVITYFIVVVIKYLLFKFNMVQINRLKDTLSEILEISSRLVKYSEKSLRLIQESELVARGFTLLSHQNPVWRLEQGNLQQTQRQCPQLRHSLFCISKEVMLIFKSETSFLLNKYPLLSEVDGVINYLAGIPLEEYGACLTITGNDENSKQELYRVTDGYSIAALKGMRHLYILQQSEYLRRLALTYRFCETSREVPDLSVLIKLKDRIKTQCQDLKRGYECHYSVLSNQESRSIKSHSHYKSSPLKDVFTAVHSLDLHLQSAVVRVRSLAGLLETSITQNENGGITTLSYNDKNFKDLFQHIRQELLACKGCWEEGLDRLEKLEKKDSEVSGVQEIVKSTNKDIDEKEKKLTLIGMSEPVIVDEVFEAYVHEQEEFEQRDSGWDEFLTPEEKAKKKREKEEAVRVLSELKNVISHRAVEREQRENIALQRSSLKLDVPLNDQNINQSSKGDNSLKKNVLDQEESKRVHFVEEEDHGKFPREDYASENFEKTCLDGKNLHEKVAQSEEMKFGGKNCGSFQIGGFPLQSMSFTANVAAMAAARSHMMGLEEQTFGDDDDSDESDYDDSEMEENGINYKGKNERCDGDNDYIMKEVGDDDDVDENDLNLNAGENEENIEDLTDDDDGDMRFELTMKVVVDDGDCGDMFDDDDDDDDGGL